MRMATGALSGGGSGAEDNRVAGLVVLRELLTGHCRQDDLDGGVGAGRRLAGQRDLDRARLACAERCELATERVAGELNGDLDSRLVDIARVGERDVDFAGVAGDGRRRAG